MLWPLHAARLCGSLAPDNTRAHWTIIRIVQEMNTVKFGMKAKMSNEYVLVIIGSNKMVTFVKLISLQSKMP